MKITYLKPHTRIPITQSLEEFLTPGGGTMCYEDQIESMETEIDLLTKTLTLLLCSMVECGSMDIKSAKDIVGMNDAKILSLTET